MITVLAILAILLVWRNYIALSQPSIPLSPTCCRYCSTGKACGNGCINKNDKCIKPKGCACDGNPPPKLPDKDVVKDTVCPLQEEIDFFRNLRPSPPSSINFQNPVFQYILASTVPFNALSQNTKIILPPSTSKCLASISKTKLKTRDIVVTNKKFNINVYDSGTVQDSLINYPGIGISPDIVNVFVDSKLIDTIKLLPAPGTVLAISLDITLRHHEIKFVGVSNGIVSPDTVGVAFDAKVVVLGDRVQKFPLLVGVSKSIYVGFPYIGVSKTEHPQSACHIVEVWEGLGQENKPRARSQFKRPKLLSIDRLNAKSRRILSTSPYICPSKDAKDEYPQAVFLDNGGQASIKCVYERDNSGSGSQIGNQINGNKYYGSSIKSPYGKIENGSIIEMVILE